MRRTRRVKIVATLGPASYAPEMIERLFEAGVDVFRINMSHSPFDLVKKVHAAVRTAEANFGRPIGILCDLQGLSYDDMKSRVMGELKKVFRPELLNRIDEVIVFHKLAKEEIKSIVDLLLKHLREQMATHEVTIELTDEAKDLLVDAGYDPAMGARPLRRAIQRLIEDPLADFVLGRTLEPGSTILVARKADEEAVDITVVPGEITPESVVTVPPSDEVAAAPEDTGDDD